MLVIAAIIGGARLLDTAYCRYFRAVYPIAFQSEVVTEAHVTGISPALIYAVIHTESSFDPDALSPADAKGLMQLTDDTYQWAVGRENRGADADPKNLFDPATNIHYGAYVLALLREQFENTDTVLAAYNAGQGRVREWLADPRYSNDGKTLKSIPYPETAEYVRRVKQAHRYYTRLYGIA